jgi:transposase-like protein
MVVTVGVAADGRREVFGLAVGDGERGCFWTGFLRSWKPRGLETTRLVMLDAHTGLKKAISTAFRGTSRDRCRVHFMRSVPAMVPKVSQETVGLIIRGIPTEPDVEYIQNQFAAVAAMPGHSHFQVPTTLTDAQPGWLTLA